MAVQKEKCNNDGGRGIGAGHVCRCVREKGHTTRIYQADPRTHGCSCGALW